MKTRPVGVHTSGWTKGYRMPTADDPVRCARCGESKPPDEFRRLRNGSRASYCKTCQRAATQDWRARNREAINEARRSAYQPRPKTIRRCESCSTEFEVTTPNKVYCSDACYRGQSPSGRSTKPDKRVRRLVLERDGWVCYLCGHDIDRARAWPDDLSGSIDHVTPLSAGGSDDVANLRAAHWRCNQDKGDKLVSEIFPAVPR